jgi:hypothetical protein
VQRRALKPALVSLVQTGVRGVTRGEQCRAAVSRAGPLSRWGVAVPGAGGAAPGKDLESGIDPLRPGELGGAAVDLQVNYIVIIRQ